LGGVRALDEAPFVDVFSPEFDAGAVDIVDDLRARSGVVRTPIGVMVIRRGLVQALLADRRLRSAIPDIVRMQGVVDGPIHELIGDALLSKEGAEHARIRKLVNRSLTPRAIDRHRPAMRRILDALLTPVAQRGRVELVAEVADHYPIQVMCELLGVPAEDHDRFAAWNKAITWVLSFELGAHLDEARWGVSQMDAYVAGLIAQRRLAPEDDLVTSLVRAEDDGDRLSDGELRALIGGLLFAGFDTTRNQLGLALALFAERPDQWAALVERPELVVAAVDEVMRFHSAVGVAPRLALEDVEIDGWLVPAGTMVALSLSSANHDPAAFTDPRDLDITAARAPHHTFGGGPHYCLGANLARAEMQEALLRLTALMPTFALDGDPTWRPPLGIFGPETLPLRFPAP
jgi:cytochrome P450